MPRSRAVRSASSSRRDLPMPGSPWSRRNCPRMGTSSKSDVNRSCSSGRPTSGASWPRVAPSIAGLNLLLRTSPQLNQPSRLSGERVADQDGVIDARCVQRHRNHVRVGLERRRRVLGGQVDHDDAVAEFLQQRGVRRCQHHDPCHAPWTRANVPKDENLGSWCESLARADTAASCQSEAAVRVRCGGWESGYPLMEPAACRITSTVLSG